MYYIGDRVRVVQLVKSVSVSNGMKKMLGKVYKVDRLNGKTSVCLDKWMFRFGDIELIERGSEGMIAEQKETEAQYLKAHPEMKEMPKVNADDFKWEVKVPPEVKYIEGNSYFVKDRKHGHCFNVGVAVKILKIDYAKTAPYLCEELSQNNYSKYWLSREELSEGSNALITGTGGEISASNSLSNQTGTINLNDGCTSTVDFNQYAEEYLKEIPSAIVDKKSITHSFQKKDHVELIYSESDNLQGFIGMVGWIERIDNNNITVGFLTMRPDTPEIRAIVKPEDIRNAKGPLTHSHDWTQDQRRRETDFRINMEVEIINDPRGYYYRQGDRGIIESRLNQHYCIVQFQSGRSEKVKLTYMKVLGHRDDTARREEFSRLRGAQSSRGGRPARYGHSISMSDSSMAMNMSIQAQHHQHLKEMSRMSMGVPHYRGGMDPITGEFMTKNNYKEGIVMRPDTPGKPLKIKPDESKLLPNGMVRRKVLFDKPVKLLKSPIKLKDGLPTIDLEPVVKRVNK